MFIVEFEGAYWNPGVRRALEKLKRRTVNIRLLGSYRPSEH